jgi:predicted RNA-binding Zn-ribbon protein involved in translation (DUF1610 family)
MTTTDSEPATHAYPCGQCGARVEFKAGSNALQCPYCGHTQEVAQAARPVREHDFRELATLPRKPVATIGQYAFTCGNCGATTQSDALSQQCQFCAAPMVAPITPGEMVAPEGVLPFAVDKAGVRGALRKWVSSRWFAPGSLKKVSEAEKVTGTYLPHWTYDTRTVSDYRGERGEHYYVTETYTETVNGQTQTKTRQVQKTRWYPASGQVRRDFDDVLVAGTGRVDGKRLEKLEPWPLTEAVAYQPDFLAGYQALRYDVEPEAGLETAKRKMAPVIEDDCARDIGGDEQRVHQVDTRYFDLTYKLLLLPVWLACYLHAGKTYQVMVNARTGEVLGERPYSAGKIIAAIVSAVLAIVAIVVVVKLARG